MKSVRTIGFLTGCIVLVGWTLTLLNLKPVSLIYNISVFNFFVSVTWLYGVCTTSYKNRCRFLFLSLFWICLNLALLAIFTFTLLLSNEPDKLLQEYFYITVVIVTCVIVVVISCTICKYLNEDDDQWHISNIGFKHQPRLAVKKPTQKATSGSDDDEDGDNDDDDDIIDGLNQRRDNFFVVSIPDSREAQHRNSQGHTQHQHNYDSYLEPFNHGMNHTGVNLDQSHGTHYANDGQSMPSHQYHSNDTHYTPSHSTHHDTHTFSRDTHTSSHDSSTADTGDGD